MKIGFEHAGDANSHMRDLHFASRPGSLSTWTSLSSAWTMSPSSSSAFIRARSLESHSSQARIAQFAMFCLDTGAPRHLKSYSMRYRGSALTYLPLST